MKKLSLAVLSFILVSMTIVFQNCGSSFDTISATLPQQLSPPSWLDMASSSIVQQSFSTDELVFPRYSLLPLTEAGGDHESMPAKRRTNITSKFHAPTPFFKSSALNIYNPNVIKVPDNDYPFRMYFFGWAKEACNTHLPYHPEHNLNPKKHENWCDAIFLARATSITGPWQVLEEDSKFRNNLKNPEKWKPILHSNGRNIVWDYHHTGDPAVVYVSGIYFMAYTASGHDIDEKGELNPDDRDSDFSSVAGAYSHDGINWIKLAKPLLVSEKEAGFAQNSTPILERTNVNFARPTMMYEEGKFKIWFDYWLQGFPSMGYAELEGPPNVTTFSSAPWTVRQGDDKPAIRNWINPAIIKTPEGYFSYSDALLDIPGDNDGWKPRRIHEAYSPDGLTWTITGHLPHLPNCTAHAPEAILLNNEIHLFYHCVGEKDPDKDTMFLRKRKDFSPETNPPPVPPPPFCNPGSKQACSVTNGQGEKVCNSKGSAYRSCSVVSCNSGYDKINNSCVKRSCKTNEAESYITTSLTYFNDAKKIALVAAVATQCHNQVTQALQLLNQTQWECTRTDATVATVRTCVSQIEQTIKQCQTPETIKAYLRTAVIYLDGAVNIPKVAAQARICLNDLKKSLAELEPSNWPCPQAQVTFQHISTCIEKVIKPNLGQN